jgi:hypothetical protein
MPTMTAVIPAFVSIAETEHLLQSRSDSIHAASALIDRLKPWRGREDTPVRAPTMTKPAASLNIARQGVPVDHPLCMGWLMCHRC